VGKKIVVDGSNIAYVERSSNGDPRISNIIVVRKALVNKGYDPIIIVDANLRYEIDDPRQLEALLDRQEIRQAPAETDADYFVLELAKRYNSQVISNDQFERYKNHYSWIEQRRVPLMIVEGQVEFYGPKLK
jgi:nicotinamide riboside kinase